MALLTATAPIKLSQVIGEYDRRTGVNVTGSSSSSVTVPTGTSMIIIELWGGGGTGGTASTSYGGGGGGGGGYGFSMITSGFTAGSSTLSYNSGAAGANSNVTPSWTGTAIEAGKGSNGGNATAGAPGGGGNGGACTNAQYNVTGNPGNAGALNTAGLKGAAKSGRANYGITQGTADSGGGGGNGGTPPGGAGVGGDGGKVKILFFGAPTANTLASFTRYGNYVPNHGNNSTILVGPLSTTNRQKLTNYLGTGRNFYSTMTLGRISPFYQYDGFSSVTDLYGASVSPPFGTMSTTTMGTAFQASTQTTIASIAETLIGGTYILNLYLSPNTTGIYWSKFIIGGTTTLSIDTTGAPDGTLGGPSNLYVSWFWTSLTTFGLYNQTGTKTIEFII